VDEALGTDDDKGMLAENMEKLSEITDQMTEEMTGDLTENIEALPTEKAPEETAAALTISPSPLRILMRACQTGDMLFSLWHPAVIFPRLTVSFVDNFCPDNSFSAVSSGAFSVGSASMFSAGHRSFLCHLLCHL